ncbi:MAG: phenylalanine--tRNA ligase subunit alpha [Armatimonadetes bacterium]|nr:phenylalanine--tRNA ligase subunit alpha [Armatimonadota bacterium]
MTEFDSITALESEAASRIAAAGSSKELDDLEVEYLGRKGKLTQLLRSIGDLPPEQRPLFGSRVNQAKSAVEARIDERRRRIASDEARERLKAEALDVTLPGRFYKVGRPHVLLETMAEIKRIFVGLGYQVVESPEIEDYKYNFEALNYPEEHPAMDEQMSFYITDRYLLRTQTTAVQKRVMERQKPPLRICTLGKCYRYEAVDATHSHTFHQVDCFAVDEHITFADLKGTLVQFCHMMFGPDTQVRFRPDFFPFVEPGAEIAISTGGGRWLELGGAGMIHPNVLEGCGIDSEKYTGFAFGLGIDRMPMIKHGIDDLRLFMEGDLRFLRQF